MASDNEIMYAIMNGISFSGAKKDKNVDSDKVKTKAKGKKYHTGSHGSGASKHKAEIRAKVKQRPSQKANKK